MAFSINAPARPGQQEDRLREALGALLAAVLESGSTAELLHELLSICAGHAGAQSAAATTRDGHRVCWPRSSTFDDFDTNAVWTALDAELAVARDDCSERSLGALTPLLARGSDGGTTAALRLRQWMLCEGTAPVAAVCLRLRSDHELSKGDEQLFRSLWKAAGRAVSRQLERERLERGIRARDDRLTAVAHELRNPVNVIVISANYLLQRATDPPTRRSVERIVQGAQRADRLIQDLLDLNAIEHGRFSVDIQSVNIAELVLSALESQQGLAAAASIILASDLAPELPQVRCDQERVLEVLENLIGNSIKFTSPGGTITIGASRQEDAVRLWVHDTGCGVPAEHMPHLFERFWRGETPGRRGTGLGLAICKAIVDAHGGVIWAESRVGEGTSIHFTIPAERRLHPRSIETAKILVVDDRPENLIAMRAILDRPEYDVITASSGQEALRLALQERFTVALIDVKMPDMSGIEVARYMKQVERTRDVPIIFVTAFGKDPDEIHNAYDAGCVDYLVKPLDAEIVRKKVAFFAELSWSRQTRSGT